MGYGGDLALWMDSTRELIEYIEQFEYHPHALNTPANVEEIARMFNVMGPLDTVSMKVYATEHKGNMPVWQSAYSIMWGNMRSASISLRMP